MHDRKRRLPVILGMTLIALAVVFPISASARERERTIPPDVLGAHVWTGELCDGTAVSVLFHVTDRGKLVFDQATGAPATARQHRGWFRVRFDGTRTRVLVWTNWRHGTLRLHVASRQGRCEPTPEQPADPAPAPPDDGGNGQTG